MKLTVHWGARINTLTAQVRLIEMRAAARHLTEVCEKRCIELGVDTITLNVGVTHELDTLIRNYLPADIFKLIERPDTEDEVLDDLLIYTRA